MRTVKLDRLGLTSGARLLDLGCGEGRHTHAAYYDYPVEAHGLDRAEADVLKARQGFRDHPDIGPARGASFHFAVGDALALPYPDASFDAVICSEVFEHIPDCDRAMAEMARVMKPGARAAVSVPRAWPERICWRLAPEYAAAKGGHVRIFRAKDLTARLKRAGFRVRGRGFAHGLHSPYWWLRCLLWTNQERSFLVRQYKRFLEWDILERPRLTRVMEAFAAPIMGKSLILYVERTGP